MMEAHTSRSAIETNPRYRPRRPPGLAAAIMALILAATAAWSCGQREALVGKYEAVSQSAAGRVALTLELQADGKGYWSVETDNAPFRWDLHKNTIRLHTPTGGVIQGTLDQGSLLVSLPGQGVINFTKVR